MNEENLNRLFRITDVAKHTSLAKSTIWLWVSQGKFPKPLSLSPTVKVWRQSDIDTWINSHT
jgi:prophage regulatory protein